MDLKICSGREFQHEFKPKRVYHRRSKRGVCAGYVHKKVLYML